MDALRLMPVPANVGELRSLVGGLTYYREFIPKMAARTKAINGLLKKGVEFKFTPKHEVTVREILDDLSSSEVLAFPDYESAASGGPPFMLVTDASNEVLGAVVEQRQLDGAVRPLWFLSRSTLPNKRNWTATELEAGAIVWAVKKNRPLFYGVPFQIYRDHQPLRSLLASRRRCRGFSVGRMFLARTRTKLSTNQVQITDPADVDVYLIGASGILPRDFERHHGSGLDGLPGVSGAPQGSSLDWLPPHGVVRRGGREHSDMPLTLSEVADDEWDQIKKKLR